MDFFGSAGPGAEKRGRRAVMLAVVTAFTWGSLLYLVAPPFGPHLIAATAGGRPRIRIVFPQQGQVINIGTLVVARVPFGLPRRRIRAVTFQYSPNGKRYFPMVGASPDGLEEFAVLWNTNQLAGGDYVLRAKLVRDDRRSWTDTVRVHVNEQPLAVATAQVIGTGSVRVRFDAGASMDPDGRVIGYRWDFGDGGTGEGQVADHTYEAPGSYGVTVVATDNEGGEGAGHYEVDVKSGGTVGIKDKTECGCASMTIRTDPDPTDADVVDVTGPPEIHFTKKVGGIPEPEQRKLGAFPPEGTRLDPKADWWTVKCRFQVVAELVGLSEPALCAEGQRVQRTDHLRGADFSKGETGKGEKPAFRSSDPRYDSGLGADDPYDPNDGMDVAEKAVCAYDNPEGVWCDDEYHGGGGPDGRGVPGRQPPVSGSGVPHKLYEGQERILWLDGPGWKVLPRDALKPDGVIRRAKFEAVISGSKGTCRCSWEVIIRISSDGEILENRVANVSCN